MVFHLLEKNVFINVQLRKESVKSNTGNSKPGKVIIPNAFSGTNIYRKDNGQKIIIQKK